MPTRITSKESNENDAPRVSVILPCFNCERYVKQAIISVLNQSFADLELILIDDGSTDRTAEIANSFGNDPGFIFLKKPHTGLSDTLNYGIRRARGKYIARIDADDLWEKNKLKIQVQFLEDNPAVKMLGGSVVFIDEQDNIIQDRKGFNNRSFMSYEDVRKRIIRQNIFCSSSVIYDRDICEAIGYYNTDYRTSMDYELWTRIIAKNKVVILGTVLVYYRISSQMMTQVSRKRMLEESIKIRWITLNIYPTKITEKLSVLYDITRLVLHWTKKVLTP